MVIYAQSHTTENLSLRQKLTQRLGSLQTERSSWITHGQQVTAFLLPRNGRYFVQDRNKGGNRWNNILDSTGTRALRIMSAGLMAGASSPARPWFQLQTSDPSLNDYHPVKVWLDDVVKRILHMFARSNTYRMLPMTYKELGAFGTAAVITLPDFDRVLHHYPLTFGEFCIDADYQQKVNTLYREFETTTACAVREFGFDKVSDRVKAAYTSGNLQQPVQIVHAIEPRDDRERTAGKLDGKNKAWRSVYFEVGANNADEILREAGFDRFPVLAPRWDSVGGDVYGEGPGTEALGDIKQLMQQQLRKGQGIDFMTKPPLQGPSSLKNRDVELLPGGMMLVDSINQHTGVRPMFEVRLDLSHLLADIQDVRERINRSFFADLFLMIANDTRSNVTATEIAERHEEKLQMLGPVLEHLHSELLEPLVDMAFARMLEVGALPPPPPEMSGMNLNIEFISLLAQAQRAIGISGVDRFMGNIGATANLDKEVIDNVDFDFYARNYRDLTGVDPRILRSPQQVKALREARNKALAAKEQTAMLAEQAGAAKDLAAAPTGAGQQNALTDLMNRYQGYGSPTGVEVA